MGAFSTFGTIFSVLFINPVINLLVLLYSGFIALHIPYAFGFSILALTALFRIILFPLIHSQLKTSKKMQELTPHLNRLKEQHKNDAARLQSETMKLYQEHGVNPAAGCLPLLIQFPLIAGFYSVLTEAVKTDQKAVLHYINNALYPVFSHLQLHKMWDQSFFGLPLGLKPSELLGHYGWLILLIPLLTAVLQLLQSKMMFASVEKKLGEVEKDAAKTKNKALIKEVKKEDDFATAFQSQSLYIFPLMIGYLSWGFPIGLSLYWNTFTIFGILQQYMIGGLGGLTDWLPKKK
ncbi:MAG TPA: YidC/Oxa1 family membrane protein insertase [Candidatus Saccharimonadales bacterium]|nr:YidC/Oxa1 family membrane protein insertase [Candidatus Saccharimonadales bacterium]